MRIKKRGVYQTCVKVVARKLLMGHDLRLINATQVSKVYSRKPVSKPPRPGEISDLEKTL
jgi:hypothetical protein